MIKLIPVLINILIVGLFLFSKLLPHKDKLYPHYKSIFNFFNKIFSPVLNFLKNYFKPFQVGVGLLVDMTQFLLLIIFLIILNLF